MGKTIAAPARRATTAGKTAAKEKNKLITVNKISLELTHLDKLYWPGEGITKAQVIDYYNTIHPYIQPYLRNRPESLRRTPNGIKDEGFFQKDAENIAPEWAELVILYSESARKDIHYLLCNNKATLLFLANLGCIELNPWNSRIDSLEQPDYLVMDIDPSDKNSFDQVVEICLVLRDILESIHLQGCCKTSGASGMHIYLPLGRKYDYEQCRELARLLAQVVVNKAPSLATIERSLSKRAPDKIYIDHLQNKKGQTLATAYSLRPRKGATVSAPLEWKEVKKGLSPQQFNIKNMGKRLQQKGDLFSPVLGKGIHLPKAIEALQQML